MCVYEGRGCAPMEGGDVCLWRELGCVSMIGEMVHRLGRSRDRRRGQNGTNSVVQLRSACSDWTSDRTHSTRNLSSRLRCGIIIVFNTLMVDY